MAIENVNNPIDIAISGMRSQGRNMEVISSNIANARTADVGDGSPYRRLEAVFRKAGKDDIGGVELHEIAKDQSEFQKILDPGHPMADEKGYVQMPNVSIPIEMMNMSVATRAYQANAAILKRYQKMVSTTLELLR